MGMLSKAIKSDVLTGNTKYRNGQEKIGEIIEYNEEKDLVNKLEKILQEME